MKKAIIIVLVIAGLGTAAGFTLANNKRKIDEKNKVVDRSRIPVAVTAERVKTGDFSGALTFAGVLESQTDADVSVTSPGKIKTLSIEKGSFVSRGQVVGTLDTEQLKLRLKGLKLTESKLVDDEARIRALVAGNAAPETNLKDIEYNLASTRVQIEQLEQQISDNNIQAPISGVVTQKNMEAGEFANPGMIIAKIVDISRLKVVVFVNEKHIYKLAKTQEGVVTTDVLPGQTFHGKVSYISPVGDENHNYRVEVTLDDEGTRTLRAGTYVMATLGSSDAGRVMQISSGALISGAKDPMVYVVEGDHVTMRKIVTGRQEGEMLEVISGLKEGEQVVVTGQINLAEGSLVELTQE